MSIIKSAKEIGKMYKAGQLLARCHQEIARRLRPGVSTLEIDRFVERYLHQHGATPEQKGFLGYPYATCASVNECVCHGFPTATPLQEGDIFTIDMVVNLDGWLADSAWSYEIKPVSSAAKKLLQDTKKALYIGIEQAYAGNRIGDISHAIQSFAQQKGYSIVQHFVGHGIGQRIHEDPAVPHTGPAGKGELLKEGMVITIEPILTLGSDQIKIDKKDGWSARTVDGSLGAQYEHTIAITSNEPLLLTRLS
ncbi:type I methionyl aminopeptidase [Mechercharimyces sp. CAU 1602]|uniref:type I methionyl aminopeptidase n=1 Tax=Mechercharimyces sp. CAU 1602 TaxID=2973933 RepID=UPI002162EF12|nr:type I methionyl aminopeptidase [Mechercharimyces sp. CAU 1602]MCS1351467.1 type I methionyl aminopeptidase [Mechercharimyces sp. CAU 1602]